MPTDFAAMWNRGQPYTPSRSTRAMAGISSSFARDTKSSGREAPSRKLNADDECSSTYFNRRFLPRTNATANTPQLSEPNSAPVLVACFVLPHEQAENLITLLQNITANPPNGSSHVAPLAAP